MIKLGRIVLSGLLMLALTLTTSCEEDEDDLIVDFYPLTLVINVEDSDGHNLLCKDGSLHNGDFTMEYEGINYPVNWDGKPVSTRYYMPHLYGLYYHSGKGYLEECLIFEELDGSLSKLDLKLRMPDGKEHDIHINRDISIKRQDVFIDQEVFLDGKIVEPQSNVNTTIYLKIVAE